jgi:D-glycero-D-manno-heptose 1,7-bisphosphate phosphatase
LFPELAVAAVNQRLNEQHLAKNPQARIDLHEYCPHHPDAPLPQYRRACDCRKPRPGMILAAADKLSLDLSQSWLVGDAPRDIEAGATAGCRTILFEDPSLAASPAAEEQCRIQPDFRVGTLREAADRIAANR